MLLRQSVVGTRFQSETVPANVGINLLAYFSFRQAPIIKLLLDC